MSFDYARLRTQARQIIERYGAPAVLRKPGTPTGPAYDPTPGAPTDYPLSVVIAKFSTYEIANSQGRIQANDEQILMAPENPLAVPTPGDKLLIGASTYTLIGPDEGKGIETIAPGGTAVLFLAQARK
jgi:hypothetical protein